MIVARDGGKVKYGSSVLLALAASRSQQVPLEPRTPGTLDSPAPRHR